MGVNGIMESLSSIEPGNIFFVYSDILIAAQGIIIFIMFVLRPRVLKLIKQMFTE